MNALRLRVEKYLFGHDLPEFGVIVDIYPIPSAAAGAPVPQPVLNQLVPTGYGAAPLEVFVDPGRYLVQAVMPSGERIREDVTVPDAGPPVEIVLRGEYSPHEWASWHNFYGLTPGSDTYYQSDLPRGTNSGWEVTTTLAAAMAGEAAPGDLVSRGLFFALPQAEALTSRDRIQSAVALAGDPGGAIVTEAPPRHPYDRDGLLMALEFDSLNLPEIPGRSGPTCVYRLPSFPRYYLFAAGEGVAPQYCAIPAPWTGVGGLETQVGVLVQRRPTDAQASPGLDQGYRLAVLVRDQTIGSMLGYLASGQLDAAAVVLARQVREGLWRGPDNPLAAVAAGYVMVASGEPDDGTDWLTWANELMQNHAWLPDAAIVDGSLWLARDRAPAAVVVARNALLTAFRRGLPFYSRGVGLLLDGLALLSDLARKDDAPDPEVEEALKFVRRLALRTSPRLPFTTVLLG